MKLNIHLNSEAPVCAESTHTQMSIPKKFGKPSS